VSGRIVILVVKVEHLSKRYGPFAAVDDVSFSVEEGEVVAVLGPNGAGKTTMMRMLTGFLAPTAGSAEICGVSVMTNRISAAEQMGYLPENCPLYEGMTPLGMLEFFGRARGLASEKLRKRIKEVSGLCGITEVLGKKVEHLSRGYRQRSAMACAMLHEPKLLILDEPTSGLDPNQIREVRSTLKEIGRTRTILFSTHVLQEVTAIATRVILISAGKLVFDGTPEELSEKGGAGKDGMDQAFHILTGAQKT